MANRRHVWWRFSTSIVTAAARATWSGRFGISVVLATWVREESVNAVSRRAHAPLRQIGAYFGATVMQPISAHIGQ